MLRIKPDQHGSTFGGNPLGSAIAMCALRILQKENLAANAENMGIKLRTGLKNLPEEMVSVVRGKGLLNAIVVKRGWYICPSYLTLKLFIIQNMMHGKFALI